MEAQTDEDDEEDEKANAKPKPNAKGNSLEASHSYSDFEEKASDYESFSDDGASDFEEKPIDDDSSESPEEVATSSDEDDKRKKSTPRGKSATKSLSVRQKQGDEAELWKPGAKLLPGTQVIIKKPKARDAGDTPFTDETIHPNTMLFLQDLKKNNDRQWLKLHDPDFRAAFQDFSTFTEKVSEKIVELDETIPELPVKDVVSLIVLLHSKTC